MYNNKQNNGVYRKFDNNNGGNKQRTGNRPMTKVFTLHLTGTDNKGAEYNFESVYNLLSDLQAADVFTKLSVPVFMDKKVCLDRDDVKGVMSVARIQSYDVESGEISIMFFTKSADYMEKAAKMVIIPRVRIGRDSTDVITILGFDLVAID